MPPEFTTDGLVLDWYVTPDKLTLVDDGGTSRASALADSGPDAINVAHATMGQRPAYLATGLGGQPALSFTAARGDVLNTGIGGAPSAVAGPLTIYAWLDSQTRDSGNRPILDVSTGRIMAIPLSSTTATGASVFDGAARRLAEPVTGEQSIVWTLVGGTETATLHRNGVLVGRADYTERALGGQAAFGGHYTGGTTSSVTAIVGRVRVYVGAHDTATRNQNLAAGRVLYGFGSSSRIKRVMWVGDSITESSGASQAEWRRQLQDLFAAEEGERLYHPIGPRFGLEGVAGDLDDYCYAVSGATSAQLATTHAATYLDPWSPDAPPNIIPILAGTNDTGTLTAAQMVATYTSLLEDLSARYPNALLIAQKLLPRGDARDLIVTDWNDNYHDSTVATAVGNGINVISDDTLALDGDIVRYDGTHPDVASGAIMAAALKPRVEAWMGMV